MDRRRFLGAAALAGLGGCAAPEVPGGRPAEPAGALRRIGVASCTDETRPQPLWDTVLADRPDLFIFGGDNVYASAQPFDIRNLQTAYGTQARVASFARLRAAIPHVAMWDDHDYGLNDGGAEFAHKQASKEEFLKFWGAGTQDARRTREGVYDARVWGPPGQRVQVILLDTRWFRSPWKVTDQRNAPGKERYVPDADPAKTLLGEVQWRWLAQQLREPAELRLVFSGCQVVVQGHGWERWGNLPLELQRLYRTIAEARADGVVLLSGDRHIGAIYREAAGTQYPLYELTSSGVTHPWATASEAGPNRLGELFTEEHYGTVEIDWARRSLQLMVKDLRGTARRVQAVAFDELKVRA